MTPAGRALLPRKRMLQLHRWAGLTFGWLVAFVALTGASMAFRGPLEPVVDPGLMRAQACAHALPADELLASAQAAHPNGQLDYIRSFNHRGAAARVRFRDEATIYIDECSGRVLGEQHRYGGLFGTLEKLHTFHFLRASNLVAGSNALVLAVLLVSLGVALAVPSLRQGLVRALKITPGLKGKARHLQRHRSIALAAAPLLALLALTGLPQAFAWARTAIYAATLSEPERPLESRPGTGRIPAERALAIARTLSPGAREILMHVPARPGGSFEIFMIDADAPHRNARSYLYVDAHSGAVLRHVPYERSSLGAKIYFWTLTIHTAEAFGPLGRLLWMLVGIAVPYAAYSGLRSWLAGRKGKSRAAHAPAAGSRQRSSFASSSAASAAESGK